MFLPILLKNFFYLVLKLQAEQSMVPTSPNFTCHFFYESNIEGTDFRIVFILCLTFM